MIMSLKLKTAYLTVASATCLILSAALPSQAVTFSYGGTTAGAPTWNSPIAGNPPSSLAPSFLQPVGYSVFGFNVGTSGSYNFQSITQILNPNTTFLYKDSFNASNPLSNVLIGAYSSSYVPLTSLKSSFNYALNAGTNYFFVNTESTRFNRGSRLFENRIEGKGSIIVGAVPVPTPALLPGLIGMGMAAFRKRNAKATEALSEA